MAAAATRRPIASKKRKVSADLHHSTDAEPKSKKKSPLYNKPQNFYAPPSIASMTKDELSEWRKEERRRRNRESAAASRNKIKGRIEELEGDLQNWKHKCAEMEKKMRCMERHIQFLTKLNGSSTPSGGVSPPPPPQMVSHPNSPPRSPVPEPIPNTVTSSLTQPPPPYSSHVATVPNLFPLLLSEPKDSTKVETQKATVTPAVVTANTVTTAQESKKHINLISRQA